MNKKIKKILLSPMNLLYRIKPESEVKLMFYIRQGYKLNIDNPITFNEKLNWMKLYHKNDLMPLCADKYTVRRYVKSYGYGELLNHLLWEGFKAEEIPFDQLPQQFVIKVTHGSGFNIICKNKAELNINLTIKKLNQWLRQKYLPCYGEWFYGRIKPRIIIEEFLSEDGDKVPTDYKLYYFNHINGIGNIGLISIHMNRFTNYRETFYDADWEIIPALTFGEPNDPEHLVSKPKQYEKMIQIAKRLAEPFAHARIDFYVIRERLYFSEITFMPDAGFSHIRPREFELKMGEWIKLPPMHAFSYSQVNDDLGAN